MENNIEETTEEVTEEVETPVEEIEVEVELETEAVEETEAEEDSRNFANAKQFRNASIRDEFINEESRRVRIALTSEAPVSRSFGLEILDHSADSIDMSFMGSQRAPLLLDHDMTKQIGVVENYYIDESAKRTIAEVRFGKSELANEIFNDVKDGIRSNVSVGYNITNMERDSSYDEPAYRVGFQPLEASIVSIPADQSQSVGIGRSDDAAKELPDFIKESGVNITDIKTIQVKTMTEKNETNVDDIRSETVNETRKSIAKQNDEILELGSRHFQSDLARQAIKEGTDLETFRGQLLNAIPSSESLETSDIGLSKKETRDFSILKAVYAMSNPTNRKAQEEAKFEFEASQAAKDSYGRNSEGLTLPNEVMGSWTRDVNTSDDSGGVGTEFRPGDFIQALRDSSAVLRAGATVFPDLVDNVKIPKQTGVSSAAWIATEGGSVGESELTLGSISLSPNTISAYTDITNKMLANSSLSIENLVRNDLAAGIGKVLDVGALDGSGSSGQPTGINNFTGVNSITLATGKTPTWAETVNMEALVLNDNVPFNRPGYLTTSEIVGNLKTTAKASSTAIFIMGDDGRVNGHDVTISNAVGSTFVYFGMWADMLVGFFGGIEILVDPYTAATSNLTRIRATQFCDVNLRHGQSFTKATA
ncbi:MAG: phage major capsid protein [Flavobacteriales bacterium]|nr:phage major capsid protein [Flavobacteriales bacterium]